MSLKEELGFLITGSIKFIAYITILGIAILFIATLSYIYEDYNKNNELNYDKLLILIIELPLVIILTIALKFIKSQKDKN